jgi:hypothetical protein
MHELRVALELWDRSPRVREFTARQDDDMTVLVARYHG